MITVVLIQFKDHVGNEKSQAVISNYNDNNYWNTSEKLKTMLINYEIQQVRHISLKPRRLHIILFLTDDYCS